MAKVRDPDGGIKHQWAIIELEVPVETPPHAEHGISVEEILRFHEGAECPCKHPEQSAADGGKRNREEPCAPEAVAGVCDWIGQAKSQAAGPERKSENEC